MIVAEPINDSFGNGYRTGYAVGVDFCKNLYLNALSETINSLKNKSSTMDIENAFRILSDNMESTFEKLKRDENE